MPLAAIAPIVGASLIGGGASIASSLINKKKSSGGGTSNSALLPAGLDTTALQGILGKQQGLADTFQKQGLGTLEKGSGVLEGPLKYLQSILGGDRTAIMEAMAPEVANINAQFRAPLAQANITGRGSSLLPDLEAGRQSAISNQLFQARPAAADKLTGIAQGLMTLGTTQEQMGAGVLSDASHEILDYNAIIRGIQAQQSAANSNMWGQLGSQLGPLLAKVIGGLGGEEGGGLDNIDPNTPGVPGGGWDPSSSTYADPALMSSLLNLGGGTPNFYSSWLGEEG